VPAVQSIQRAFMVLQQLASHEMGVTELATACDLPKSTVARLLKTLELEGAVEQITASGAYRIGPSIASMAGTISQSIDLIAWARPHLVVLAHETGEDAGLSVPDGYRAHYVAQEGADNPIQVRDWTGELVPMHVVASGLVMLAHWPEEALDRFLSRPLLRYTDATVTDPEAVRKRLATIRAAGHVWGREEFVEGINAVAAPILDTAGRPRGAIHVHGPAYRFPPRGGRARVAALVSEKARLITEQLDSHSISK
jgi:DNA-binding IclR family transcriptional regulator